MLNQPGALAGDSNGAVTFNGTSQYGTVASSSSLGFTNNFTVEAWIKRSGSGLNQPVLGKPLSSSAKTENYALWIDTTNKVSFELGNGTGSKALLSTQVLDTNWHYVVATFASGTLSLPDRSEIEAVISLYGLSEWAGSMDVELPRTERSYTGSLNGEVERDSDSPSSGELAVSWSRTIRALHHVAKLRANDRGRAGIQGPEARDAASGLIALGRGWLVWARQSSEPDVIAVGVTQLLAAQGVFVASWEQDRRAELFPGDDYLRQVLRSTRGIEWLAEHGAEIPSSLSM